MSQDPLQEAKQIRAKLEDAITHEARQLIYEEYLKSEHWKVLKRQVIKKKGEECEFCGSPHSLELHHLRYKNWHDCTLDDLILLCREHHQAIHNNYFKLTGFKIDGWSNQNTILRRSLKVLGYYNTNKINTIEKRRQTKILPITLRASVLSAIGGLAIGIVIGIIAERNTSNSYLPTERPVTLHRTFR